MTYATTDPYTGEVVKASQDATDVETIQAIEDANTAFLSLKQTSFAERSKIMQLSADLLRENIDDYAKLLTLEMGKITSEAKAEVELSAAILEYYAKNAEGKVKANTELHPLASINERLEHGGVPSRVVIDFAN